jgi:beta-lactamase class C
MLLGSPAFALQQGGINEAIRLIEAQTRSGQVAAASLYVRNGSNVIRKSFGQAAKPDAVFLLASITKPMTVSAVMLMSDRGQLSLTDPVQRFIPEFRGNGRERVQIRHLLTHTSGLPDMLPENVELRKRHAPLSEFVAGACRTPLLFAPGEEVRYQSMGILLAAEIVSRIAHSPFPAVLEKEVFRPLGMRQTSLGLGGRAIRDTMQCQVEERTDYDWNSPYWRNLGAPWGGAHSNVDDVARFLQYFAHPDHGMLKPQTAAAMITDQTPALKQHYGYGWRLNDAAYGKGSSASTFGHGGSTGTLCWHDPRKDRTFVLLTTKPADQSNKTLLHPVSGMVSGAIL